LETRLSQSARPERQRFVGASSARLHAARPERTVSVKHLQREFEGGWCDFLGCPVSDASKYKNFGESEQHVAMRGRIPTIQ
jgi:hypothetical protein